MFQATKFMIIYVSFRKLIQIPSKIGLKIHLIISVAKLVSELYIFYKILKPVIGKASKYHP